MDAPVCWWTCMLQKFQLLFYIYVYMCICNRVTGRHIIFLYTFTCPCVHVCMVMWAAEESASSLLAYACVWMRTHMACGVASIVGHAHNAHVMHTCTHHATDGHAYIHEKQALAHNTHKNKLCKKNVKMHVLKKCSNDYANKHTHLRVWASDKYI